MQCDTQTQSAPDAGRNPGSSQTKGGGLVLRVVFAIVAVLVVGPVNPTTAQEVDAMVIETRSDDHRTVVHTVLDALRAPAAELGRTSRVLSDLEQIDSLSIQDIQLQRQTYRDFGNAYAEIPEIFNRHFPAMLAVFDSLAGDIQGELRLVASDQRRALAEFEAAGDSIIAAADTLDVIAEYAATLPDGRACDIHAEPNTCGPKIAKTVGDLDRRSARAEMSRRTREIELAELEVLRADFEAAAENVAGRVRTMHELRDRLRETATELSKRLRHVDAMLRGAVKLEDARTMLAAMERVHGQIESANATIWEDWGRVQRTLWSSEDDAELQSTAERAQRIRARRNALTNPRQINER